MQASDDAWGECYGVKNDGCLTKGEAKVVDLEKNSAKIAESVEKNCEPESNDKQFSGKENIVNCATVDCQKFLDGHQIRHGVV